ncbi:serine-rich adhesin for platelets-like [Macrobrachium nipponense]|uniref:serine-rich adhesin for platelets-like n=1 Tax=Macrobrachium nipponense TaxID=159736 RepID=UPI0030C84B94
MEGLNETLKVAVVLLLCLIQAGLVSATPLPTQDDQGSDREGKGFLGFSFFAPPARVEPHQCIATNGLLTIGTCYNQQSCTDIGGVDSGSCSTGGVCCVLPSVCGSVVARNRTWFVNKDFPEKSRDSGDCTITIRKEIPRIKQARLDFHSFQLASSRQGRCLDDMFEVSTKTNVNGREEKVEIAPKLCGDNTGQHVYVDIEHGDAEVHVKLGSSVHSENREWRVFITQLDETLAAPRDCLQYHTDASKKVKSLNFDGDDDFTGDLNYDICFTKLQRSSDPGESCKRKVSNVEIDQSPSVRQVRKRNKRRRIARSSESRELPLYSSPEQSLEDKQVREAISDVIGQISRTIDIEKEEGSLNKGSSQPDKKELNDEERPQQNNVKVKTDADSTDNAFPMLYSAGNEAVISQIQQVVLQLQQEQLGLGGGGGGQFGFGGMVINTDEDSVMSSTHMEDVDLTTSLPSTEEISNSPQLTIRENSYILSSDDNITGSDHGIMTSLHTSEIDSSVNSVSNIVNELLTNHVTHTTETVYPLTDNLAVEGIVIETTLLPEEVMKNILVTESPDKETVPINNEQVMDAMPASSDSEDKPTTNSSTIVTTESSSMTSDDLDYLESETTENIQENLELSKVTTTEGYEETGISNSAHIEALSASDDVLLIESHNKSEPGRPQAEITVLDPDSVKVHGDLIIKDGQSNENENSKVPTAEVTTKSVLGVTSTTTDKLPTVNTEDITTAFTVMMEMEQPIVEKDDNHPLESGESSSKDSTPIVTNGIAGDTETNAEDQANGGIQWLILDDGSSDVKEVSKQEVSLPPDVIVSSDIGFGFYNEGTENSPLPSTNKKNGEQSFGNLAEDTDLLESELNVSNDNDDMINPDHFSSESPVSITSSPAPSSTISTTVASTSLTTDITFSSTGAATSTIISSTTTVTTTPTSASTTTTTTTPSTTSTTTTMTTPSTTSTTTTTADQPEGTSHDQTIGNNINNVEDLSTSLENNSHFDNEVEKTDETKETAMIEEDHMLHEVDNSSNVEGEKTLETVESNISGNEATANSVPEAIMFDTENSLPATVPGSVSNADTSNVLGTIHTGASETTENAEYEINIDDSADTGEAKPTNMSDAGEMEINIFSETEAGNISDSLVKDSISHINDKHSSDDQESHLEDNTTGDMTPTEDDNVPENDSHVSSTVHAEHPPINEAVLVLSANEEPVHQVDISIAAEPVTVTVADTNTESSIVNELDASVADSEDTLLVSYPSDEERCGGSFLKVREDVICGGLLRQEAIEEKDYEDDRFDDVERISVRSMEGATRSLRFQLQYETDCPEMKVETTTAPPVRKTVTLLQYLLGWYR